MILIDTQALLISSLMANIGSNPNAEITEDLVRHMVLSSILYFKGKFQKEYGTELVFCCDSKTYWRKEKFPYYKIKRKAARDNSGFDWKKIFELFNTIKAELKETFPYKLIEIEGAEADDVIGALVKHARTVPEGIDIHFGKKILILSSDHDYQQLQRYEDVYQYSLQQKRYLSCDDPIKFELEHIIRGDSGDGVPNFLSQDDIFVVEGKRQASVTAKKLELWLNMTPEQICENDPVLLRNFNRNKELVSFSCIPEDLGKKIVDEYHNYSLPERKGMMKYFLNHKLKGLVSSLNEF